MITECLRAGWRAALANRRLVLTLWAWFAVAGLVAGLGVWRWLAAAFNHAPEADRLLARFQVGLFVELTQYDRFSPPTLFNGAVLGLIAAALISNPLIAGGVLEVIVSRDDRPLLHRFFRGAGHFFGRFLRLLIISAVAALVLVIAAGIVAGPIVRALGESSWERMWVAAAVGRLLLFCALVALAGIVLDLARARVVLAPTEVRGMLRAWLSAARLAWRNVGAVVGTYAMFGVLLLVVVAVYAMLRGVLPAVTWPGIVLLVLLQQVFVASRAALRIAGAAAGLELCRRLVGLGPEPSQSESGQVHADVTPEAATRDLTPA